MQLQVILAGRGQAQLGCRIAPRACRQRVPERIQPGLQRLHVGEQRRQRLRETGEIPERHLRLRAEAVTAPLRIGGVGRPVRIEVFHPAIGTIVDGEPEHGHVVGVHHPVHEAHPHPVRHHFRGAHAGFGEPLRAHFLRRAPQVRKIAGDAGIHQLLQQRLFAAGRRQFEAAETQEGRRGAAYHRAWLRLRIAVIQNIAHHLLTRADQRQRACGGHAKVVHGFTAQEFADG